MNTSSTGEQNRFVEKLRRACDARDRAALRLLLHPGVTVLIDGGGTVSTAEPATGGADKATTRLIDILEWGCVSTIDAHDVNGATGLLFRNDDQVVGVVGVQTQRGRATALFVVLGAEKLTQWNTPGPGDVTGSADVLS